MAPVSYDQTGFQVTPVLPITEAQEQGQSVPCLDAEALIVDAYKAYSFDLFRHCRFRRFSQEDAEEIVQEAFLNAWEYLRHGNEVRNLRAFLYRVVNNLIVDRVRKEKLNRKLSLDALQEEGFDPGSDETHRLQERLDARALLGAARKVGEEEHALLHMRYIRELKPADIALEVGVSPNTVSVRLHRALKKVSAYLRQGGLSPSVGKI